jgi:sarcosine oxidase
MSGVSAVTRNNSKLRRFTSKAISNGLDNEKNKVYDAIVVGLGGVGSFALRSLAKNSKSSNRVLGMERFKVGHELGSSHGDSRLFRHAYFEHPNYVPLCLRSTEIFQELCDWKKRKSLDSGASALSHVALLERCGILVVSDKISADGTCELVQKCLKSAEAYGIPVELLDSAEMDSKYGHLFKINGEMKGLLEPGAGFVRPELALRYAIEDAVDSGAKIVEDCEVESIKSCGNNNNANMYHVETSDGQRYQTRSVLVSAGAWTSKVLPQWAPYLKVTRQIQAWFEPQDVQQYRPSSSCGWYLDRCSESIPLYGFPSDPLSSHHSNHVKLALHGRNVPFNPDDPRPDVTTSEIDEICNAVRSWIPEAPERMVASKACLYTMSPDEHFILDRAPSFGDDGNVWCIAGLSGHGFKMTPALGEVAADLMIDGRTDLPVEFLNASRLKTHNE